MRRGRILQFERKDCVVQLFRIGIICSQFFPGLWLDKTALLAGDMAQFFATLQLGLAPPEHFSEINN